MAALIMNWIIENGQVLSVFASAFTVYLFIRKAATKDVNFLHGDLQKIKIDLSEIKNDIKEIHKNAHSLDSRISRIEGQLMGYHFWEPKIQEKK